MVITFICDICGENENGLTVSINRLKSELEKRNHTVRIVGCVGENSPYNLKKRNFGVFNGLLSKNGVVLAKPDDSVLCSAINDADIVHIELPFKCGKRAVKICQMYNKPFTASFHLPSQAILSHIKCGNIDFLNNIFNKRYNKKVYKFAKCVHCPTNFVKNKLRNLGYSADMCVASNGVPSVFQVMSVEKPEILKGKICILSTGRLSKEKRHDLIIEGVLRSKYEYQIQLIFAGSGPRCYEILKRSENLTNKPIIKHCTAEELAKLNNICDLYIHASDIECEGLACVEAFTCGLVPIISNSKHCATQEYALFKENLFEHNNPYDLAQKIDFWIENRKAYEFARKKYVDFGKNFKIEKCVDVFENMLITASKNS